MSATAISTRTLAAIPLTEDAFAPFGHVIAPLAGKMGLTDGDRALDLGQGTPRFFIMNLSYLGLSFRKITRHRRVTQVLAAANNRPWLLGVAPPCDNGDPAAEPDPDAIRAFAIPGGVGVQLHRGTWHAGPHFTDATMPFFNLELTDTNQTDHHSCDLAARYGLSFEIVP